MTTTLCLNMIVKNESRIITRLFDSVLPIIDTYCICDTGSTDNTVEVIESYFREKNITGKIVHEPFQNFCYNRNKALHACIGMSDYVLLLDADMVLEIKQFDKAKLLQADSFHILQGNESFHYQNMRIVKNNGQYNYVGVTHEYLNIPNGSRMLAIRKDEIFIRDIGDGGAKSDKFERDINLLQNGIQNEPNNARYHFYLANSYHDIGQYEKAIEYYKKRTEMNGWKEEVWYSYYRIGLSYKAMKNYAEALYYWFEGYMYHPDRLETLYEIISYYRIHSKHKHCLFYYKLAKEGLDKNIRRDDFLFLHNDVYTHLLYYEYSIFAAYVGVTNIDNEVITILNHSRDEYMVNNLISNMKYYKHILKPKMSIHLSEQIHKHMFSHSIPFHSSSSCLIPNPTGDGYLCNIRYVNYTIDNNGSYKLFDNHIISLNKLLTLDKQFNTISSNWMSIDHNDTRPYIGIEDVRLYYDTHTSTLRYIGNGYHQTNNIGVVTGYYKNNETNVVELTQTFNPSTCEKNWTFVNYRNKTHIIYQWYPLTICNLPDDNVSSSVVQKIDTRQMPGIFSRARGSTCAFQYTPLSSTNIEMWFVVHIVSYEEPRHYYHMFVVFDNDMNLLRYSAPFKIEGESIEYCLSIVVEHERVLLNYSTWDRTSTIALYDKSYIDSIVKYT